MVFKFATREKIYYNVLVSTLKNNITARRLALLAAKGEKIFHIRDVANLWNIQNKNTLRIILKRYCDAGIFYRIYRGLYSLVPIAELDPLLLGSKALSRFCFVSAETILYEEGFIAQSPETHTFISNTSRHFTIDAFHYRSRKLADRFLFNPEGVSLRDGISRASAVRAIADILYFSPRFHFDREIDWQSVRKIQKKIGYPLTPFRYDSPKTH